MLIVYTLHKKRIPHELLKLSYMDPSSSFGDILLGTVEQRLVNSVRVPTGPFGNQYLTEINSQVVLGDCLTKNVFLMFLHA